MKTFFTLIFCACLFTSISSQSEFIDSNEPISNIDFGYSPNHFLMVTISLNPKNKSVIPSSQDKLEFEANIEGQVIWSSKLFSQDPSKKRVSADFQRSTNDPLTYTAILGDGAGAFFPTPEGSTKWLRIDNLKLRYQLGQVRSELPYMKIFPPTVSTAENPTKFTVDSKAKMIAKNKCVINVFANNKQIKEFTIQNVTLNELQNGKITNTTNLGSVKLGENINTYTGTLDITIDTPFNLSPSGSYSAVVQVTLPEDDEIYTSDLTSIYLYDAIRLSIKDPKPEDEIRIGGSSELDINVRTEGNGELFMRFTNKHYEEKVKISKLPDEAGDYTFKLTHLDEVDYNSFSYFYFTDNGIDIQPAYLISKTVPDITDFNINTTKDDIIQLNFSLPKDINSSDIQISITKIGENDPLIVGGSKIIRSSGTGSLITADLSQALTEIISNDTIREIKFDILYKNKLPLYSISLSVINSKVFNKKIAELVAETSSKKKMDKQKIADIVVELAKIGETIGNSIDKTEVDEAISSLQSSDKDKVRDTISEIGKWAAVVGKIAIMFA